MSKQPEAEPALAPFPPGSTPPPGGPTPGLRSLHHAFLPDAQSLQQAIHHFGKLISLRPLVPEADFFQVSGRLQINGIVLLSYSGAQAEISIDPSATVTLNTMFAGAGHSRDPLGEVSCSLGGSFLLPCGTGDRVYVSAAENSVAALNLEPREISRTAAAMAGRVQDQDAIPNAFTSFTPKILDPAQSQSLQSLLLHIDDCAAIDLDLPARLGLDDVILRLTASWLNPELFECSSSAAERLAETGCASAFDDLTDYIRANLDQPLRLSNLEARCFYSRRSLQYAFRQKMGCSPKQWIREQRLIKAMEWLKQKPQELSIQAVALRCGYRRASQFSTDFKRRFGVAPSRLLRPALY